MMPKGHSPLVVSWQTITRLFVMKFIPIFSILSAAVFAHLAQGETVRVTYDALYDNPTWPLSSAACSRALGAQWPTLGSVPNYPFVGGIPGLTWASTLCGTWWQLKYTASNGTTSNINITAVDAASYGFNISKTAFSSWVGSSGVAAGSVTATAVQLPPAGCGIF